MIKSIIRRAAAAAVLVVMVAVTASAYGQGINLTGVGPVNRSMGGAGTAAPLEAMGALNWNPASLSALPTNEVGFGLELLLADIQLASTIGGVTNETSGEAGFAAAPSIGWVHHVDDSPMTVGLGIYAIGGFRNNLPRDAANPLLAAGPAFADAEILQLAPTVSWSLTDKLSVGIAPTVTAAKVTLNPLGPSVVTPLMVPGQGNRLHWGGGFQAGVYYVTDSDWHFGFTYKSRQWLEDLRFFSPSGVTRFDLDYPMILSLGAAYSGIDRWTFAVDVRYFDYKRTAGFRELGFQSVFAAAVGVQYHLNDRLYVRGGYNFNQNPIRSGDVAANAITPLIQSQNVAAGLSYRVACNVDLSLAYVWLVPNSVQGPLPGAPAGSTIGNEVEAHSAILGLTVRY